MKINELVEALNRPRIRSRFLSREHPMQRLASFSRAYNANIWVPGGAYAWGKEDPKDPHMFRKKWRMPADLQKDAYFNYIADVVLPNQDNPFFPRIYDVILKTDTRGRTKPDVRMEKLVPYDTIENNSKYDPEIMNSMLDRYFVHHAGGEVGFIEQIKENCFRYKRYKNIRDPHLREAAKLINDFIDRSSELFELDIHKSNVMFRVGPTGPQLVFTDPAQDHGASIIGDYNPFID